MSRADDLTPLESDTVDAAHPPSVFISYAHEDAHHQEQVRAFWIFLRSNGIDAKLDLPATDRRRDWALWMLHHVRTARFVLVIASPAYRTRGDGEAEPGVGKGVQWEAALIREEVFRDSRAALQKFVPVVLPGQSAADIPTWLGPTTTSHYHVNDFTVAGADGLLRLLTGQPGEIQPPLGRSPVLPPRDGPEPVRSADGSTGTAASSVRLVPRLPPIPSDDAPRTVAPIHRLFLHFFDTHFLDEIARGRNSDLIAGEARKATRMAVLAAETVFVPAASYIESDLCAETINEYRGLFDTGQIVLVGGEANLIDFATAKLLQYEPNSERFKKYEAVLASSTTTPPFRSRTRSATRDIRSAWLRQLDNLSILLDGVPTASFADFESKWAGVPEWLGERAFTPEYVVRGLFHPAPRSRSELVVARRAGSHVNSEYFRSYTTELMAGIVTNLMYLNSPYTGDARSVDLPFRILLREFQSSGVTDLVLGARPERLIEIRDHQEVAAAILRSIPSAGEALPEDMTLAVVASAGSETTFARAEPPPSNPLD